MGAVETLLALFHLGIDVMVDVDTGFAKATETSTSFTAVDPNGGPIGFNLMIILDHRLSTMSP